jgi:hypothetical protein
VRPRNLEHVQADEIRLKTQAGVVWVVMALIVTTRLWLGGAISPTRDRSLIERLVVVVAGCASFGPLLFVTDGLKTYIDVVRKAFRRRQTRTGGRLCLNGSGTDSTSDTPRGEHRSAGNKPMLPRTKV